MSLVQTYLENNGYDYYGNAAEDTLVFFVRDEEAPIAEEPSSRSSNEAVTNLSDDTVNGISGGLSSEASAVNTETHAEAYKENGKDTSTNLSINRDNTTAGSEYSDAPVAGSLATLDSNVEDDEFRDSVPKMAEMDAQQTDTTHSIDADFKA